MCRERVASRTPLAMANGLDSKRLFEQHEEIDRLNEGSIGIMLLKGIEVDILEDGSLDLPDEDLGRLDVVVGAVHSHATFNSLGRSRPSGSLALWTALIFRSWPIRAVGSSMNGCPTM